MKLFLQHTKTNLFFKDIGVWTEDIEEAREFPTALNACFFSVQQGLIEVEIVEAFSPMDEPALMNIPVGT